MSYLLGGGYVVPGSWAPGWEGMRSAPRDGTEIVLSIPRLGITTARWANNRWEHPLGNVVLDGATHWCCKRA